MISKAERQRITAASRIAFTLLASLKVGDAVTLTEDGRVLSPGLYVSREARRSGGEFGSWESLRVTVTYGPGRYATEVSADAIGAGRYILERVTDAATLPVGTDVP